MDDTGTFFKILSSLAILLFVLLTGKKGKTATQDLPSVVEDKFPSEDDEVETPREFWQAESSVAERNGDEDFSEIDPFQSAREAERRIMAYDSPVTTYQEAASLETLIGLGDSIAIRESDYAKSSIGPAADSAADFLPEVDEASLVFGDGLTFDLKAAVLYQIILERRYL